MKLGKIRVAVIEGADAPALESNINAWLRARPQSELVGQPIQVAANTVAIFYVSQDIE